MPVPPPLPDPVHIETRLLVVAQLLEHAVAEVRRTMAEIRGEVPAEGGGVPPVATPPRSA